MSRLLVLVAATLVAGSAMAQSLAGDGGSPSDTPPTGSSPAQDPVTGGGATTGGVLGASGGAIVQPGSTPATSGASGTGAMGAAGAGDAQPQAVPGAPTGPSSTSSMRGLACPAPLLKRNGGCVPPQRPTTPDRQPSR